VAVLTRLAIAAVVFGLLLSAAMFGYSWQIGQPPLPREPVSDVDLIALEMTRAGATQACLSTDGVFALMDADGELVGKFDLLQKKRPGVSGGGMDDGRATKQRGDFISVTRIVQGE